MSDLACLVRKMQFNKVLIRSQIESEPTPRSQAAFADIG